ncbi:MAG: hypothetical protein GY832_25075 [Chloroflexi bacterium]|nr:hypothetical protein [Chloroflexota bacterium]
MDSERITEIAKLTRLEAEATPGPWKEGHGIVWGPCAWVLCSIDTKDIPCPVGGEDKDINLAVAARNALPRLLAERAEMVEENKRLRTVVDELAKNADGEYRSPGLEAWISKTLAAEAGRGSDGR